MRPVVPRGDGGNRSRGRSRAKTAGPKTESDAVPNRDECGCGVSEVRMQDATSADERRDKCGCDARAVRIRSVEGTGLRSRREPGPAPAAGHGLAARWGGVTTFGPKKGARAGTLSPDSTRAGREGAGAWRHGARSDLLEVWPAPSGVLQALVSLGSRCEALHASETMLSTIGRKALRMSETRLSACWRRGSPHVGEPLS